MSHSLPLPVLLLPFAVLEKRLIIQVLWILPHSSILLPVLIDGEQEVPEIIHSRWWFGVIFGVVCFLFYL